MSLYLISYDITESDDWEYSLLWERLKEMSATKILDSAWMVADRLGQAEQVYGSIAPLTQTKDRLLVHELTRDALWDELLIGDAALTELLKHARS
jgi:hypothetical protein